MTRALAVEGLGLRFGGVTALDGVSFAVEAGDRLALVGPNGAGKTSVLNCISGVERASSGRILLQGRDVTAARASARAAMGLARTLQGLGLVDDLTVLANLLLGRHHLMRAGVVSTALQLPRARREEARHRRRCAGIAAQLELGADLHTRAADLAPGARKRLELGRALAQDARVLLLDEPFAGAGPDEVGLMVAAIGAATDQGASAVIVDHDLATLTGLADRALTLEAGRIVTTSTAFGPRRPSTAFGPRRPSTAVRPRRPAAS